MILTFAQLLDTIAINLGRAGSCNKDDPAIRLKAASLLQEYVHRSGSIKRWDLISKNNQITLPKDVGVILKARVNGVVEPVHSKWYQFFDNAGLNNVDINGKHSWTGLIQETNTFPTVYDLPCEGGYILAELGCKCTKKEYHLIVQGTSGGKDVYTKYKGETIHGERLDLESGILKRSITLFDRITAITKVKTDDYVKLYYQTSKEVSPVILSLMTPRETVAEFRRAVLGTDQCQPSKCYSITLIGRVEIFSDYHDNDIIPITELAGIETLSQAKQSINNNNVEAAGIKYQIVDRNIDDTNNYNRNVDTNIDIVYDLSFGNIDSLI